MPAIALVGAAASVTAGLGAIAAAGGLAAMSIGSALAAGAMVAGGVLTGLGTLTGNKKLTRIGAVLGLAGGIGTALSGASSAASSGLGQAVDATGGLETATSFGANELSASLTGSGPLDFSGAVTSPVSMSNGIVGNQIAPPGSVDSFYGEVPTDSMMQAPADTAAMAPGAAEAAAMQQQTAAGAAKTGGPSITGAGNQPAVNTVDPLGDAWKKIKGFGSDTMDYINNPKNANTVKLGSGLVSGAMKSYDQQRQYDQQLADREAQRARFNRSIIGQYTTR